MFDDIERPLKPKNHVIGQILDSFSVADLDTYISDLRAEIERVEQDKAKKAASQAAAQAFFKN